MIDVIQNIIPAMASSPGYQVIQAPGGPQGVPARQDLVIYLQGALAATELVASVTLAGAIAWTAANSSAHAKRGATGTTVISFVKNGVYANALAATPAEIAAGLWATITFPAGGQAGPQAAVVAFVTNGAASAGDTLDAWAPASPDPTLSTINATLAGA